MNVTTDNVNPNSSRRGVKTASIILLIFGYCATLIVPILLIVQKKVYAAQAQFVQTGDFVQLRYWQSVRDSLRLWLGPSILVSFFAGIVAAILLPGGKKIFGILLSLISILIFLALIPAT